MQRLLYADRVGARIVRRRRCGAGNADYSQQPSLALSVLVNAGEEEQQVQITDPVEVSEIQSMLAGLPHTGRLRDLPEEIRAFRGTIRIQSGKRVRYYHDTHELERWLDGEARRRGIAIP